MTSEIKDTIKWIPFEIKPEIDTPYRHYLVWFRGYYGKVKDGSKTIGVYSRDDQSWNILESNNIRDCVPTHYADINPPKDKSADSPLYYEYGYGGTTMDVKCKECHGFIEVRKEDFCSLPITVNDVVHDKDCKFLADKEVNNG
jgi:hypothetical protein